MSSKPVSSSTIDPSAPIGVTILGATGSIGINTLDVLSRHPNRFRVIALTANTQVDRLYEQCVQFQPEYAVMVFADAAQQLDVKLKQAGLMIEVLTGEDGLELVASLAQVDYVMAAIVGAAGLRSTLAAARGGKRVLLANKEALVMSGKLFMDEVQRNNAMLLPIDSEHNAIFQCMPPNYDNGLESIGVRRILLTASGGPFRTTPKQALQKVTPAQACAHPNWDMGKKISVDSATMMNKGLEIIEACWLFNTNADNIQVVLHPQSVIHSMVEYTDGSVLAQLGNPDMRTPIAHALGWPSRIASGVKSLDLFEIAKLSFEPPDLDRFPGLRLAMQVARIGGTSSTVLNAANEVAVQAFLDRKISFLAIPNIIEHALSEISVEPVDNLEKIFQVDDITRKICQEYIDRRQSSSNTLH
ncbi:MAG: 1-deoxy-D-xylulose-5-phosphate reductoisomerase [Gammaproteobacteria bacterium]|nr:1-deoxy-D-xylulose-5-phosphate reductoisomerase [Gammaproteobacteria bacterium]